ncbi:MAG: hypothetical protein QG614_10 [Patescibacteria group bacterium]|nr:hypothetical protein [Patescibacteria group bacterium]
MQKQKIITGLWKFHEKVPEKQLIEVATEWAKEDRYTHLYIRKVSKDQYGIGFMYDMKDTSDSKKTYNSFFEEVSDRLKRQFGNDLVGWDISSSTIIIK